MMSFTRTSMLSTFEASMARVALKELRLRNYRAFADARLVLGDVTFLVGRNGAGKSTLMDAFSFVREAVTDSLGTALERRGNFLGLFPRDLRRVAQQGVSVAVCLDREGESPIVYGFTVGWSSKRAGYFVKQETLIGGSAPSFERDEKKFRSETVSLQPAIDAETLLFPLIAGSNDTWKAIIESLRLISIHQFSPQAIRGEHKIGGEERLSHDGDNAGDVLKHFRSKDKEWVEQHLSEVVPGIREVRVKTVGGRRVIEFAQECGNGHTEQFEASVMSDGTLRSLGILLALKQRPLPSIALLDEIEDSLHPLAHGVLLDAIDEASAEFPIVVSTHNPDILNHPVAQAERVRVVQRTDGASQIFDLSENVRAKLKPPLTVGQLLRSNALWTEAEPSTTGPEDDFFKP
jgi:predicted ATPase